MMAFIGGATGLAAGDRTRRAAEALLFGLSGYEPSVLIAAGSRVGGGRVGRCLSTGALRVAHRAYGSSAPPTRPAPMFRRGPLSRDYFFVSAPARASDT